MSVRIEVAKNDAELWDSVINQSSQGTIFHTWRWLKCVKRQTRTKLYPLKAYDGDELLCILPLFVRKKGLSVVYSPPSRALLLYMGLVFAKEYSNLRKFESAFSEFVMNLNNFLESEFGSCFVRIRTSPSFQDVRPLKWAGYSVTPHYTLHINLQNGLEQIWKGFDKKVRNNIRKTEKENCKVEFGEWEELNALREILAERFIAQGMRPSENYYRDYLLELFREFYPENMKIFAAKKDGEIVGGFVGLAFKDRLLLWIGIPRVELRGVYPNDLAIWEGIKWAKENGYKYFEIMDAGDDARLSRYKSQFNPKPEIWFSAVKLSGLLRILNAPLRKILR